MGCKSNIGGWSSANSIAVIPTAQISHWKSNRTERELLITNMAWDNLNIFSVHYVSGKLPIYPFPKPTFCPKWEVSVNVGLGEG